MSGGCPLLNDYTLPGERLRGCSFAEGFKDLGAVARNSVSITGTPVVNDGAAMFNGASDIRYDFVAFAGNFSLSVWFKADSWQDATILSNLTAGATDGVWLFTDILGQICFQSIAPGLWDFQILFTPAVSYANGQWHHFFISSDRVTNTHIVVYDGAIVAGGLGNITAPRVIGTGYQMCIGNRPAVVYPPWMGMIKDVKIWDTALSAAEAVAYYDQSMFHYQDRTRLWYPMRYHDHDIANGWTLDRSRNGVYAVALAAPDTPVKNSGQRGYYSADSDSHLTVATGYVPAVSARTVFAAFGPASAAGAGGRYLYAMCPEAGPGVLGYWGMALTGANNVLILHDSGGAALNVDTTLPGMANLIMTTIALGPVIGGVSTYRYVRNYNPAREGAGIIRNGLDTRLGTNNLGFTSGVFNAGMPGNMWGYMVWEEELNLTQIYDCHARFEMQINDV